MTIRNDGGAPLRLAGAEADGDFLVDAGGCMSGLAPGARCTLRVRFAPTAAGPRTGSLRLASNDPAGPRTVALSGTGVLTPAAPAGAKGDPGAKGEPGAQGPPGAPGPSGTRAATRRCRS